MGVPPPLLRRPLVVLDLPLALRRLPPLAAEGAARPCRLAAASPCSG